ncbi:unnamed protein product [Moneuplotes crassus]|uniref:Uncharacterized protein n=1 Tax=Euplotes crassus TaxID=5936 RepID=A0AAD1XE51_EUPCR|nr:unnamed protein product [Moneuplotes crassus]
MLLKILRPKTARQRTSMFARKPLKSKPNNQKAKESITSTKDSRRKRPSSHYYQRKTQNKCDFSTSIFSKVNDFGQTAQFIEEETMHSVSIVHASQSPNNRSIKKPVMFNKKELRVKQKRVSRGKKKQTLSFSVALKDSKAQASIAPSVYNNREKTVLKTIIKNWKNKIQSMETKLDKRNQTLQDQLCGKEGKRQADRLYIAIQAAKGENEGLSRKIEARKIKKKHLETKLSKLKQIVELMKGLKNNKDIGKEIKVFNVLDLRKIEYSGTQQRKDVIDANEERINQMAEEEEILKNLKYNILDLDHEMQMDLESNDKEKVEKNVAKMMDGVIQRFSQEK